MPNTKKISLAWSETGRTVYAIIRREADDFRFDDADGSFGAAPADPYLSLAEDAVIKGLYEVSEARTAWGDGNYLILIYRQAGGAPAPVSDTIIGSSKMSIVSDAEIDLTNTPAIIADAVWDEVLTVATHDVGYSAGQRLRLLILTGNAARAGTANSIQLAAAESAVDDIFNENIISIVSGLGAGQTRLITGYDGGTKTAIVDRNWFITPGAGSVYEILPFSGILLTDHGLALGPGVGNNQIELAVTASAVDDIYVGSMIVLTTGVGPGQARLITAYDGTNQIATVSPDWTTNPDATTVYKILPVGRAIVDAAVSGVALASVCTEARLAELDTANLPADIAAIPTVVPDAAGVAAGLHEATDGLIEAAQADLDALQTDITFLKDIEGGRWRMTANQMIFYKSDNITEVARFDLKDLTGNLAMTGIFERVRV